MFSGTTVLSIVLAFLAMALQDSGCQSYQMMGSYPLSTDFEDRQIFRRDHGKGHETGNAAFPKLTASDIFGSISDESSERNRLQEENDSSASSDEASMLEFSVGHPSPIVKRRKGPTLSVVNPLEILRQRLMLDLARRRIHENQQQIVANAQLLENIGKRSSSSLIRRAEDLGDSTFQP